MGENTEGLLTKKERAFMASEDCSCCRFFQTAFGDRIGLCRRYPSFQNRSHTEWCGEFATKQVIALPVVDLPQITHYEDKPQELMRKPGRPKKEVKNEASE